MALRAARARGLDHVTFLTNQYRLYVRLHWTTHQMLTACDEFTDTLEDLGFDQTAIYDQVVLAKNQLSFFLQQCNLAMSAVQFRLHKLIAR